MLLISYLCKYFTLFIISAIIKLDSFQDNYLSIIIDSFIKVIIIIIAFRDNFTCIIITIIATNLFLDNFKHIIVVNINYFITDSVLANYFDSFLFDKRII